MPDNAITLAALAHGDGSSCDGPLLLFVDGKRAPLKCGSGRAANALEEIGGRKAATRQIAIMVTFKMIFSNVVRKRLRERSNYDGIIGKFAGITNQNS